MKTFTLPLKKINLLHALVLFIVVTVIVTSFLTFSREKKTVYVYLIGVHQPWEYDPYPSLFSPTNSIKVGDASFNASGEKIAEVISVDNFDLGEQRYYKKLGLKINALYNKRAQQYQLSDSSLQIGQSLSLTIGRTVYEGTIAYIGDQPNSLEYIEKTLNVEVKIAKAEPWLAVTYNSDFVVFDGAGNQIFKIIKAVAKPAEYVITDDNGRFVISYHPQQKDVFVTAKLMVHCYKQLCYFNDAFPIRIGQKISLQSNTSLIENNATIIKIIANEN